MLQQVAPTELRFFHLDQSINRVLLWSKMGGIKIDDGRFYRTIYKQGTPTEQKLVG
jgi:hypothetical protein